MATLYTGGDKFADGVRTIKYSKVAEISVVNRLDKMQQSLSDLETEVEKTTNTIRKEIDDFTCSTDNQIKDINNKIYSLYDRLENVNNINNSNCTYILGVLWYFINTPIISFLNKIFHWWAFDIVNEERSTDGKTYIFYVKIILKNQMSHVDIIQYNRAFSRRIKTIKSSYADRNIYDIRYCVIPSL